MKKQKCSSNHCIRCLSTYVFASLSLRCHAHGPVLNVWCIWHTYLETLQECRRRQRIGWIIQDFWETCVEFFNVPPGNKAAVTPNPPPVAKRLMNMAHLSGNTSVVSKSSSDWLNYTGFLGDVCVEFFNVPPGNKAALPWRQTPHERRKPSCLQLWRRMLIRVK